MTKINTIVTTLFVIVSSYYIVKIFLGMTEFIHLLYEHTTISKILSFTVVIFGFWGLLFVFAIFSLIALKDTQLGLNFIIIFSPMSALPFILLGVPQAALNHIFVCRSSIIIFTLFMVVFWFIRNILTKKHSITFPFLPNILVFLLLYSVHLYDADSLQRLSILQACFVLLVISSFFYFIVAWAHDHKTIIQIVKVMALSCIVQAILSFISYYYYVVLKGEPDYSFSGLLRDYELFAEYLAIHTPLFIFLIRNIADKMWKKLFIMGLCLTIFVLIATAIRGAIASLVIAMIYYFVSLKRIIRLPRIIKTVFLSLIIIAVALLAVYQFVPASARIIERLASTDLRTGDSRQYVWLHFFDYFREKPILGYGMFYNLPGSFLFWPHSTYFYYLLSIGVFGLINFLVLLFGIIRKGWENLNSNPVIAENFELAVALNCSLIIIIIDGLKVGFLRYSNYQLFIWMIFGLIVALNKVNRSGVINNRYA